MFDAASQYPDFRFCELDMLGQDGIRDIWIWIKIIASKKLAVVLQATFASPLLSRWGNSSKMR